MNKKLKFMLALLLLPVLLTACQCSHQWTEATCKTPRSCSLCDETEGEPLKHIWQEATCTQAKICSLCSETEGEALGHTWRDATCEQPKICSVCAATEGEPLSHIWQEATCTQPRTCTLCAQVEGDVLAHVYQLASGFMKCTLCGVIDETAGFVEPLDFPVKDMTEEEKSEFINLAGQNNLRNNARFQYQDGLYYGQYWDNAGQSLFISTDLISDKAMILDQGWAKNIYLVEGNIYYENIEPGTQDHGIYRINMANGEYVSREKISNSYGSMQIKGDYIYYSDFSNQFLTVTGEEDQPGLYRCDLDGGNVTKILDKDVREFYVFDTGILYQDIEDGETIHVCYPDGSGDVKLNDQKSTSAIFDGEYIYYLSTQNGNGNESKLYSCWKMRPDGTENQEVSPKKIFNAFLIYDGSIYFCDANGKSQIFRMGMDGSKVTPITEDTGVYYVQILNGELKYTKYKDQYIVGNYLCSLDGENLREFIPYK